MLAGVRDGSAEAELDAALPTYEKVAGVAGTLSTTGSDTLAILMSLWAEEFRRHYPNTNPQIHAAGSATAPPALTKGTANLALMSRKMMPSEREAFERGHGYRPTAVPVAIDALSIYVHKDNPIAGLSIPELDAIFSSTRRCGHPSEIQSWGALGVQGELSQRPIQLFGRNAASGTYGYFRIKALCKGDFKRSVNELPGSASVVQSVAVSLNGIGYSGMGYKTTGVRALALAREPGGELVPPSVNATLSGDYPLGRLLYIYARKEPGRALPPLEREFIKMVLSKQGQQAVIKGGFIPLPAKTLLEQREDLEMGEG